jgi:hypothetical protein
MCATRLDGGMRLGRQTGFSRLFRIGDEKRGVGSCRCPADERAKAAETVSCGTRDLEICWY